MGSGTQTEGERERMDGWRDGGMEEQRKEQIGTGHGKGQAVAKRASSSRTRHCLFLPGHGGLSKPQDKEYFLNSLFLLI